MSRSWSWPRYRLPASPGGAPRERASACQRARSPSEPAPGEYAYPCKGGRSLGNWIVAARPEWMATRNTTQGKPTTTYGAMSFDRFDGVRGTAWIITARGRQERRERDLVAADQENEDGSHASSRLPRIAHAPAMCFSRAGAAGEAGLNRVYVVAQPFRWRAVRFVSRPNRNVHWRLVPQRRQQLDTHDFTKPPFEPISIDRGMLMPRHDDSYTRRGERGGDYPDIEMRGPNSLPLSYDGLYVEASRQPVATRKTKSVAMRLRTCSEV